MDVLTAKEAVDEMQKVFYSARYMVDAALKLAVNNLRSFEVSEYTLKMLKKELKNFDSVKGKWKT